MNARRHGAVLLLSLLLLVALSLITLGLLLAGTHELILARARAAALRARLAAEAAARTAATTWPAELALALRTGESLDLPVDPVPGHPARAAARIERLAAGLFLVHGLGAAPAPLGGEATARAGLLVRTLDPAELAAALPAALTTAGDVTLAAAVAIEAADAPAIVAPPDARISVHPDALLIGQPHVLRDTALSAPDFARLGPLDLPALRSLADRILDAPARLEGPGACPLPADPADVPSTFGFAPGDLVLDGWCGAGVLVVGGDLVLSGGARFDGVILVAGRMILRGASTIRGAARVAAPGPGSLLQDGRLLHDAALAARVLTETRALRRPFRPAARAWIPLF